ncbi:serine protease [Demequina capsici]|uniref:Serine protease n=1 Tax=Demequina capsici TaxID=3075620 RepID=A0AA96FAK2_9MICO|nr:serine protease [Demequina sp. PMTSA13]WNM26198.1 serine protease [Demequina sp. PMTSA13]
MRRRHAGAMLAAAALALSGCAALPSGPPPLPDSFVPSLSASSDASASASYVSDDGFSLPEHAAYRVRVEGCTTYGTGSAFAIDAHTLVTNRHVVEDSVTVTLTSYDGQEIPVTSVQIDDQADLALLTVAQDLPEWLTLADAESQPGDTVSVSGYPSGDSLTTVTGPMHSTTPEVFGTDPDDVLVLRVTAAPGSSGSAVVNAADQVVGVLYAIDADEDGWAYAISLTSLTTMLADPGVRGPVGSICASS